MNSNWYDFLGFSGDAIIIVTYILLQLKKIHSENLVYSLFNALGAGLIIVSLIFNFNVAAFVVELFWVLISLFGIAQYFLKKTD